MIKIKGYYSIVYLLILIILLPVSSLADTLPFVTLEFPPYNYRSKGEVAGVTREITSRIVRRMGHTPTFEIIPWQRAQREAARGEYAGIFTFTKSKDRFRDFRYSAPISHIMDVFYKRRENDITWESLSDLEGYDIGASGGYNYADSFQDAVRDDRLDVQFVHSVKPEILHLRKLKHERIDLAICEIRLCQFLIQQNTPTFSGIDYINRSIGPVRSFHVGFSRKWPNAKKLVESFNKHLFRLHSRNVVSEKFRSYNSSAHLKQPLDDFAKELVDDLRMSHQLEDEIKLISDPTLRLIKILNNHFKTVVSPAPHCWSSGVRMGRSG
ncbi:MAG: substrate-binding periplasmic protein [bacterium]